MFIWKVEDMKLRGCRGGIYLGRERIFTEDNSTSREDKIKFIDSLTDGKMSKLLMLVDQFLNDRPNLKRDRWDEIDTRSLNGWIKRNDKEGILNGPGSLHVGSFYIMGCERMITNPNTKRSYDTYDDLVDEVFHRALKDCLHKEEAYFKSVDPYEVAKTKLRENSRTYNTAFGVPLCLSSSGEITINRRPITIEECNLLNSKYEVLQSIIDQISQEFAADIEGGYLTDGTN